MAEIDWLAVREGRMPVPRLTEDERRGWWAIVRGMVERGETTWERVNTSGVGSALAVDGEVVSPGSGGGSTGPAHIEADAATTGTAP